MILPVPDSQQSQLSTFEQSLFYPSNTLPFLLKYFKVNLIITPVFGYVVQKQILTSLVLSLID